MSECVHLFVCVLVWLCMAVRACVCMDIYIFNKFGYKVCKQTFMSPVTAILFYLNISISSKYLVVAVRLDICPHQVSGMCSASVCYVEVMITFSSVQEDCYVMDLLSEVRNRTGDVNLF